MAPRDPASPSPPATPPPQRREVAAILVVLLLALGLRAVNIGWGLPLDPYTGYYHPDERKVVQGALDFPGDILQRTDLRYPTAYHYALGIVSWPARALTARINPEVDPFLVAAVVGRWMTLLAALLTVAGTWWLGRSWYGAWGGLAAAACMAVALVHVVHTGYVTLDVPTAGLVVAVLWAADRVVRRPTAASVALAGALTGLLIGTKYSGGVMVVPGLLAIVVGNLRRVPPADLGSAVATDQPAPIRRAWRGALLAGRSVLLMVLFLALAAGMTLLTTPTIALHPEYLQSAVAYESGRQGFGGTSWLDPEAWMDALDALQVATGWAAGLLLALALAAAPYRPRYPEALLLATILPYYLVLGDRVANRYLVLLLPCFALLLGRWVGLAAASPRAWLQWATGALVAGALLAALGTSAATVWIISQPDVRSQAARHLAEQAPDGATVCLDQVNERYAEAWKEPPVSPERYRLVGCHESPEWVIAIGNLGRMEAALASPFLRPDFTWDPEHLDWWPDDPATPEMLRFYDTLLPGTDGRADYVLAAEFTQERLPTVPFDVAGVRVWRRGP